jgi:4-hydroxythreonine-4-phosphate dehydrogenase
MRKKIAITMGDPAGIGAEVIVKALSSRQILPDFEPVVIGDKNILKLNCDKFGYDIGFIEVTEDDLDDLKPIKPHQSYLLPTTVHVDMADFKFGVVDAQFGRAAGSYIEAGATAVIKKKLDALVTAPINKKAFNLGGYNFQGHTDFLAHLTGSEKEVMMLKGGKLSVILCTVHLALVDAIEALNENLIIDTTIVANEDLKRFFNIPAPKFAVAALNPHASESGSFGHEEKDIIIPAVKKLREKGIDVTDPMPSDSLFYYAKEGHYDGIICMYHDQALIPIKLLFFDTGTNITLGINMVRTSVDHGTAFGIAGKGEANELSMINALEKAIIMCGNDQK